ncbi:MAG: TIGR01548 family HAD-type hydrolase [Gemmatimonadaceae bacterium]|nr:TIGR01548 family HAD-type hydrolase [Gloeobacterales cyanobacterium ES-bin-141]
MSGLLESTLVAFDIDGVIRDVAGSYRRALMDTVEHFSAGRFRPTMADIDALKAEGRWNNDWHCALELLRRYRVQPAVALPDLDDLIAFFQSRYFGEQPDYRDGYIAGEPLLATAEHFTILGTAGVHWGFVSGAERASALYILVDQLGLTNPPLVAMGEAPDKPNPAGLFKLRALFEYPQQIFYLGDTVADMHTVQQARTLDTQRRYRAIGVLPPHILAVQTDEPERVESYCDQLRVAGAEAVWPGLPAPGQLIKQLVALG